MKGVPRMHRSGWLFVLAPLVAVLAACGGATPAVPATTSAPAATSAPARSSAPALSAMPEPTAAPAAASGELTIFAAASLTDAFKEIGEQFSAANGASVTFNFAGSDQLATQITHGAPADVFASANSAQMNVVIQSGEVISGTQRTFVRNRLVVVYPKDNPGKLAALKDLANPGLKIVFANKSVPVGGYSLTFLAKASKLPEYTAEFSPTVLENVVSYEENVKAVLSKIRLGEADAGIVYTTDAATVKDSSIGTLDIPDNLNTIATYPIAAIKNSQNAELAKKFVDYLLGPDGQHILIEYGFISPTGT
jgi:molybdate transport system substrate-binding protein